MDATTRSSYEAALKKAEAELAGHEARGEALRRAVEALKNLLNVAAPAPAPRKRRAPVRRRGPRKRAVTTDFPISASFFQGMGPTAAYRKFVAEFGADHPVPSIRDALLAGGVRTKSSTSLLTGLHSVRRRDALKEKAEAQSSEAEGE